MHTWQKKVKRKTHCIRNCKHEWRKLPLLVIGKAKNPRCLKHLKILYLGNIFWSPSNSGIGKFYYTREIAMTSFQCFTLHFTSQHLCNTEVNCNSVCLAKHEQGHSRVGFEGVFTVNSQKSLNITVHPLEPFMCLTLASVTFISTSLDCFPSQEVVLTCLHTLIISVIGWKHSNHWYQSWNSGPYIYHPSLVPLPSLPWTVAHSSSHLCSVQCWISLVAPTSELWPIILLPTAW